MLRVLAPAFSGSAGSAGKPHRLVQSGTLAWPSGGGTSSSWKRRPFRPACTPALPSPWRQHERAEQHLFSGGSGMSVGSLPPFERSVLERKERDELATIAEAMGVKPSARMLKSTLIDQILRAAGIETVTEEKPRRVRASRAAAAAAANGAQSAPEQQALAPVTPEKPAAPAAPAGGSETPPAVGDAPPEVPPAVVAAPAPAGTNGSTAVDTDTTTVRGDDQDG